MRPWCTVILVVVVCAGACQPVFGAGADRLADSNALSGMFGFRIDPLSGDVRRPAELSRSIINSSFDVVSVECLDCGPPCPPPTRTVQVVLEATEPVADYFGVSNVTSGNYDLTSVVLDTNLALDVGERVTITITGDVLSCESWFNVWLNMCSVAPVAPACTCPTWSLIHEFAGGGDDGAYPQSQTLLLDGSTMYGMTSRGGDANWGVVFSIATDGSGFTLLHEFANTSGNAVSPYGSLILDDGTLYGMTLSGGANSNGVVFSIGTDGSAFTLLHEFSYASSDGQNPRGSLVLGGSTLYGMTRSGGASSSGVIFAIATNGTGYTNIHEFAGGAGDGADPSGSLLLDSGTLYGMTENGGDSDMGVVFKIATDGTNYTHLHEFVGGLDDGADPLGSLTLVDGTLWGMTEYGGFGSNGVIFSIDPDGSNYTVHHKFRVVMNDGESPMGDLTLAGSRLVGTTHLGSSIGTNGVLFTIKTDGSEYGLLHQFAGGGSDGGRPRYERPIVDGCTVYGMTYYEGDDDRGVIYKSE
jgi:uncharacterized repeat protein (TIGR03803 family)